MLDRVSAPIGQIERLTQRESSPTRSVCTLNPRVHRRCGRVGFVSQQQTVAEPPIEKLGLGLVAEPLDVLLNGLGGVVGR
jgi:hypothetical protein